MREQFRKLSQSLPQQPHACTEERLLREFRAHHRRRARRWLYVLEAAAVLVLVLALGSRLRHHSTPTVPNLPSDLPALAGFVALPYAQSGVPLGDAVVMRVELRTSDLPALGVAPPAGVARQRIGAYVLIGHDGMARAVRFIP
ncbi:MAG: hypothetical protein JO091_01920 [Acidobacteriaceae bacterium]|nr:hypothetical protein [Acidobacteriaceae bacterium]